MAKKNSETTVSLLKQAQDKLAAEQAAAEQAGNEEEVMNDTTTDTTVAEETVVVETATVKETPAVEETEPTDVPETTETVAEPEVVTPALDTTTTAVTSTATAAELAQAAVDLKIKVVTGYIESYLKTNDGFLDNKVKRGQAIDAFRRIVNYGIANPTVGVLDAIVKFFRTAGPKVLSEGVALQGINKFPIRDQHKIAMFYSLMRTITTSKTSEIKKQISLDRVRTVFASDDLVNYLSDRFKM